MKTRLLIPLLSAIFASLIAAGCSSCGVEPPTIPSADGEDVGAAGPIDRQDAESESWRLRVEQGATERAEAESESWNLQLEVDEDTSLHRDE